MRYMIFGVLALIGGFAMSFLSYVVGGPLLLPGWSLAKVFFQDTGGDSLVFGFTIMGTIFWAVVIFIILSWAAGRYDSKRPQPQQSNLDLNR